jgi:hypothetical protein
MKSKLEEKLEAQEKQEQRKVAAQRKAEIVAGQKEARNRMSRFMKMIAPLKEWTPLTVNRLSGAIYNSIASSLQAVSDRRGVTEELNKKGSV